MVRLDETIATEHISAYMKRRASVWGGDVAQIMVETGLAILHALPGRSDTLRRVDDEAGAVGNMAGLHLSSYTFQLGELVRLSPDA